MIPGKGATFAAADRAPGLDETVAADGQGLSEAEAVRRRERFGLNAIAERRSNALLQFGRKFWGPIAWMLEAAALLQLLLGKPGEAAIVAALLAVNAGIGFIEEGRAGRALDLLRRRLVAMARVRRDGAWRTVPASELVPGDLVHLRMGDLSPADIALREGHVLLDQSALTGESVPVEAGPGALAYAAAIVRRGEATGVVTATGAATFFGRTAELVRSAHAKGHLQTTILGIVRILAAVDAVLIALLLLYAAWADLPLRDVLPFALILLVASVPAALPATFTLATALGAAELAREGVLTARLQAIEEAAGMDVLCTDKTGTLTENRLRLAASRPSEGVPEAELLRRAVMACDAATQDPLDLAILAGAGEVVLPPRTGFEPFDPARRYALGRFAEDGADILVAKGAAEAVAALCADPPLFAAAEAELATDGARVLAVAAGPAAGQMRFLGLLALEDPPRADSARLVAGLRALGVRVVMATGDALATATAIARRVGIEGGTGDAAALAEAGDPLRLGVFARVLPEHKIALVRRLQAAGHVVGMTGDGVNDAPALRQAEVGIAVASATDVARAAAGIVLTSPGLVDALAAVRTSRAIYQRMLTYTINKIMKTLEIAVFLSLGVILTGQFVITPLLIVLLLFTNDFVTMTIATDRVVPSPRPDRWDVRGLMTTGGALAAGVLVLSFAVFFAGRDWLGLPLAQLQTLVFVMLVATGQGNVYLVRERGPFWRSAPSRWLMASSAADLVVVVTMATTGVLMAPVALALLLALLGVVAVYLLVLDRAKLWLFSRISFA
ncbi:MAG: plasma-membrane proton-efflux P-type ATPase [Rhodospirillales bacterium]|nr:plasma-membrane proton-efflux P-type ATPase [Rhodospirillales bacterium]